MSVARGDITRDAVLHLEAISWSVDKEIVTGKVHFRSGLFVEIPGQKEVEVVASEKWPLTDMVSVDDYDDAFACLKKRIRAKLLHKVVDTIEIACDQEIPC